jgi:predicted dehydrogenase
MEKKMINATLVGFGWWGKYIINSLKGSPKIKISQVVDIDADAIRETVSQYDASVSSNFGEALKNPDTSAVILATPHSLHEQQVVAAAGAGKHVFCEKPLGLTKASAARSIAACQQAGVKLGIGHERRFEPALMEIKRMVDAGELGTIMHVESNFSHDKLATVAINDWRASPIDAPAAGMTGMGIHLTDAYLNMFGPITELYAQTSQRVVRSKSGDVVSVQVRFENGATGYLSAVLVTPLFLRYQVFGSEAWVEARNETHPDTRGVTHLTVYRTGVDPVVTTFEWVDAVRENFHAFADYIAGTADYPFTSEQKLANISVLEAICASVNEGTVQKINND